ncbi:Fatty acid metabolism regulator protein [compost metagenome]
MSEVDQWLKELIRINDEEDKMTEKQLKIVQAAIEIFSEKGYAASSTSEIAQKAGVAEGTIFRHYKTKKELLLSIVAPIMSKLIAPFVIKDFTKVLEADYPKMEDFLRVTIRDRMTFARNHFPVIKILLHEIPFQPDLQKHFKEFIGEQILQRMNKVIRHFQEQGQIIEAPTFPIVRFIATTVIGLILSRFLFLPEASWDEEQEIETTIDLIMHGLIPQR